MARQIRWRVQFKSLNETGCLVNIYDDGYTSSADTTKTGADVPFAVETGVTELTGAADPFFYEEDDNKDILTTVRGKTGYLRLIESTTGALNDVAAEDFTSRYIEVFYGTRLVFQGYIQPKSYANRLDCYNDVREFPVVSPLGLLEDIMFPTYDPPVTKNMKEWFEIVFSQLGVTYNNIYMPNVGGGLDGNIPSIFLCPFNEAHSLAYYNDEELFSPRDLYYFMDGFCKLNGWTVHEVGKSLVFTFYNYQTSAEHSSDGTYVVYPVTNGVIGSKVTTAMSGDTALTLETAFNYQLADKNIKMEEISPERNIIYLQENLTEKEEHHDFNHDKYEQHTYNSEHLLTAYSEEVNASVWSNTEIPSAGGCMVVKTDADGTIKDKFVVMKDNASNHPRFYFNFWGVRSSSALRIHVKWGHTLNTLSNDEELTDDPVFYAIVQCNGKYLKCTNPLSPIGYSWDDSPAGFQIIIDKVSGEISWPQNLSHIPLLSTQNHTVNIDLQPLSGFTQKTYFSVDCYLNKQGYTSDMELLYDSIEEMLKIKKPLSGKGDDIEIELPFSDDYRCNNYVRIEGGVDRWVPDVLKTQQTRIRMNMRSPAYMQEAFYVFKFIAFSNSWRWRIIGEEFHLRNDEHRLTMHRSSSIE